MTQVLKLSIREAVDKITNNSLLLPAIQREYVWKKQAIELMFDSMLRDYPINTLMFWRINNISQQPLDFYSFLNHKYIYGVTRNVYFNKSAAGNGEKLIVIDGQQRLTSIYIGLYGTYQTVKGKPMALYIRLDKPASDPEKKYDFRFMTDTQLKTHQNQGEIWFKLNDLIDPNYNQNNIFMRFSSLISDKFAGEAMAKLHLMLDNNDYLNYYDITGYNSIDDVLEIFTRTNNSGTPLSKGDLLLSVLTTQWHGLGDNAREYVKGIIDDVKTIGYKIDRDWVIKCCLVVFSTNIKMQVSNFSSTQINGQSLSGVIYSKKDNFRESIVASFEQIKRFGLLEKGLTTKLAVIPIVQYIFEQQLWNIVNRANSGHIGHSSDKEIQKWLFRAIVRNLFEAGTDDILTNVKGIVTNKGTKTSFPYQDIENVYSDLQITPQIINDLLDTQKISAFPILNIIFKDFIQFGKMYDMDHTHPEATFKNLANVKFTTTNDETLAKDGVTYNSVRNLQLLEQSANRSKNKMTLNNWVNSALNKAKLMNEHCIPTNVSLLIQDFKTYIDARSVLLFNLLKQNL